MKNYSIGMFIIALCIIIGCSNNAVNDTETVNNEFPPSMKGLVSINGEEHQLKQGDYNWKRNNGKENIMVQTDYASPDQMADELESIYVQSHQKATILIDDNPDVKIYLWDGKGRGEEIEHKNNQFYVPASKGRFIYEVKAEWNDGSISYPFVLEIK